ncbi:hypothetical protein TNIN_294691 [Trichonephila inaurata madagascariensis]|uniref:Uncharacterized protein n=1 Tax=Trichonephila inaurata madagascariensis TaxID=2747483 RepID=A0A8X6MDM8_9ARAC|nr:hypothetical protein TNIN_294691 [Trichonephila inaurata madagascariensis]
MEPKRCTNESRKRTRTIGLPRTELLDKGRKEWNAQLEKFKVSGPPDPPVNVPRRTKRRVPSDNKKKANDPSVTQRDNDKNRKQKGSKKKAAGLPIVPDLNKCRQHKELRKDINMMNGHLAPSLNTASAVKKYFLTLLMMPLLPHTKRTMTTSFL